MFKGRRALYLQLSAFVVAIGLFFWTVVGVCHRARRQQHRCGDLFCTQPMARSAMVSSKAFRRADAQNPGTGGTAGRMEDHFFEPTSSLFPDEPAKLSLRPNQNSIPRLHGLGFHRASTWALRVCLSRDARSIWPERGAR